nr:hypothetical protein [Tanacetum cinerariifolium]
MKHYPHLNNGIYDVVERVMRLLALRQARRPRSDPGKAYHSVSSTFAHHNRGSSSHQGDDDEDDGASRASTLSPTTYLNSLGPLNYQPYNIPTFSKQNDDLLFKRQTKLLNQTQKMYKELRGGFKSYGKALRGVFSKKNNKVTIARFLGALEGGRVHIKRERSSRLLFTYSSTKPFGFYKKGDKWK